MKSNRYTYILIFFATIIGLGSFYAFDQKEDEIEVELEESIPPLVQAALDEKLQRYQRTILDKCKEKAYEAAEVYIDSLVAAELKFQASDTLKFPAKPVRPELRDPIILNDSTEIVPIIK